MVSNAGLAELILLPLGSQGFISNFIGSPNQGLNGFSIVSNANPLTLQRSRPVTGGYSSDLAIAGDYWAVTDQTYVDQSWSADGQTFDAPYYDVEEVFQGDVLWQRMTEPKMMVGQGYENWGEVFGEQETVEFALPIENQFIPPVFEKHNVRVPFLRRIHNWLHR